MTLAYRLEGPETARVLVLSSSIGTTTELWDPQLPDLLSRFRVLRYDHPGHGRSSFTSDLTVEQMADEVLGLLDELGLGRVSWCGLSLGGMVGMALALRAPDRVDRLVLACTAAYLGPPEGWERRAAIVRTEGLEAIADSVLARWFSPRFRNQRPEAVERFRRMLVTTPADGYAACCEAIGRWDARTRIRAITARTLVVVGAEDPATTLEHAGLIAGEIEGARIVTLAGAAHLANVEAPEAFTQALLDHLRVDPSSEEAA
jgi:3-oxoadipate enol-lactonase